MIRMKLGTASGYDNIHPEFLKHWGPSAMHGLPDFLQEWYRSKNSHKMWWQAKVIALEKSGKRPLSCLKLHPISLLSVCFKLL